MGWTEGPKSARAVRMGTALGAGLLLFGLGGSVRAYSLRDVQTVFLIVMENQHWSRIKGNTNCPFINRTLLPQASHCEQYYSPPGLHPTLPNYLWLVAGTSFAVVDDAPPDQHLISSTNHLPFLLDQAGISWKTYQVGLAGLSYPPTNLVYPYHYAFNPALYFRCVLTNVDYCRAHMRPYEELAGDLTNQTVARFNIISPGLWYSMHDGGPAVGDAWLASEVPRIMATPAYQNGGAIFITWDEDDYQVPQANLGMILLSPFAKGGGYQNSIYYTHSSTLRTLQTIFGVQPWLGDAANAPDLGDLFSPIRLLSVAPPTNGTFSLAVQNVSSNRAYCVEVNTNLSVTNWAILSTNFPTTTNFTFLDPSAPSARQRFYRVEEAR